MIVNPDTTESLPSASIRSVKKEQSIQQIEKEIKQIDADVKLIDKQLDALDIEIKKLKDE